MIVRRVATGKCNDSEEGEGERVRWWCLCEGAMEIVKFGESGICTYTFFENALLLRSENYLNNY